MPYPCWRGLTIVIISAAKVRKSLDITKLFLEFNMNLTDWWLNMTNKNRECSRIPYFIILTILKPINQKTYEKNKRSSYELHFILPLPTSVSTSR